MAVAIPEGYAGFVHPRSGLAHRLGLSLVNAPGTIDAGYRGEIKVNLINLDPARPLVLHRGDRIAQLVVQPVVRARFVPVDELPASDRGEGGHGSTGGHAASDAALTRRAGLMPFGRRRNRIDRSLRERGVPPEPQHKVREAHETSGPYDEADAPDDGVARIDLGAIRLPALPGMDLRVELNPQQKVIGATLRRGELPAAGVRVRRAARRRHLGRRPGRARDAAPPARVARSRETEGPFGAELSGTILAPPPPRPARPRRRSRSAGRPASSASTAPGGSCAA